MAETTLFELVSPERLIKSESVEMVVVPAVEGDVGVLPGHSKLIATVRAGLVDIHENGSVRDQYFVGQGFVEVSPERCTVLTEDAIHLDDLHRTEVETKLTAAQEKLETATEEEIEDARKHLNFVEEMMAAVDYIERKRD